MNLTFYEEEHKYLNENGDEVPSVTTILNHIAAPSYNQIAKATLEYAAMRGRIVHEALELYDYGLPFEEQPDVTPEIHRFLVAYLRFMRDINPKWESIEQIVYAEDKGFCGTVDRAGYIDGKYSVLDIKTLQSPTVENKICVCCQTAAYAVALGKPDAQRYALYLLKDGNYRLFNCKDYEAKKELDAWGMFDTCLSMNNEVERIKSLSRRKKNG